MKETQKFLSNHHDVQIVYDVYVPERKKNILVQIAHGMAEHRGRYQAFCEYLCEQGYLVVVSDHRGHGESASKQDLGYMGDDGFEAAVDDLHKLTKLMKKRFAPRGVVLLGHSMGSLLARRYMQRYSEDVQSLLLVGSPSNQKGLGMAKTVATLIGLVRGERHRSKLLDRLSFGKFNQKFTNRTGFEWLNREENSVDAYVADELCGFVFTTRSFYDLMEGIQRVYDPHTKPVKNMKCPVLFLSGEEDPCGSYGVGVLSAAKVLKEQGYRTVDVKLYPGARHELLLESNHREVYEDIAAFLRTLQEKSKA